MLRLRVDKLCMSLIKYGHIYQKQNAYVSYVSLGVIFRFHSRPSTTQQNNEKCNKYSSYKAVWRIHKLIKITTEKMFIAGN